MRGRFWTRESLESRLRRPERGENGYREEEISRLEALRSLRALADAGAIEREAPRGGINTHVHTSKSFSSFGSPAEAVWSAWLAGVEVLGISDHYTLAGHDEFREACAIVGIAPLFSLEAVALWEEAERAGSTVNDPANPGRTYLTAKGVTRDLAPRGDGQRDLDGMRAALLERNRRITGRLRSLIAERLGREGLSFDEVLALTPHGEPTERHIARALALWLERAYGREGELREAIEALTGMDPGERALGDPARLEDFLRARLVKAGGPAYVEESREAFVPVERLVSLALELGAIPTYPALLDPVTPWEKDLEDLCDRLDDLGIRALEVIPDRNSPERLATIVAVAERRGLPILSGTEHNTSSPAPLVDRWFFDERFHRHFERGALLVLGHQALRAAGEEGYVREDGSVPDGPARAREVEDAGRRVLEETRMIGKRSTGRRASRRTFEGKA